MPLVRVEIIKGRSPERRSLVLDAVHAALVETLAIPDEDRTARLVEHEPADFHLDAGRSQDYTLVEITMFPGRSKAAKRALYAAIVRNLAELGVPSNDVTIVLHEPPMQNWGIRGGQPADEVDLGFSVDV